MAQARARLLRPKMAVITPSAEAQADVRRWLERGLPAVVALCAAWCDTCAEFRATLERIAAARPDTLFIWLDIEDDNAVCGDIDIENFPTLAMYRGERLMHFGVSLPQEGTVRRLIDEIAARTQLGISAPKALLDLPQRLLAQALDQTP